MNPDTKPDFLETKDGEDWLDSAATGLEFNPTPEFALKVGGYLLSSPLCVEDLGFLLIHVNNGNLQGAIDTLRDIIGKNDIHDLAREHMTLYAEQARKELEEQNKEDQAEYERWSNEWG